jgi:hypothetical protein
MKCNKILNMFMTGLFIGYQCCSKSRSYSLENDMRDDMYRKGGEEAIMKRAKETMKLKSLYLQF